MQPTPERTCVPLPHGVPRLGQFFLTEVFMELFDNNFMFLLTVGLGVYGALGLFVFLVDMKIPDDIPYEHEAWPLYLLAWPLVFIYYHTIGRRKI